MDFEESLLQFVKFPGVQLQSVDAGGNTVLHLLFAKWDTDSMDVIKELLPRAPELVNVQNKALDTPMHQILRRRNGSTEDITLLTMMVNGGRARLSIPDAEGNTAMHLITCNDHGYSNEKFNDKVGPTKKCDRIGL